MLKPSPSSLPRESNQKQFKTRSPNHPQAIAEKHLVKLRRPLRGLDELPAHPARGLFGLSVLGFSQSSLRLVIQIRVLLTKRGSSFCSGSLRRGVAAAAQLGRTNADNCSTSRGHQERQIVRSIATCAVCVGVLGPHKLQCRLGQGETFAGRPPDLQLVHLH